jgi:HPr Serine kinase C-terminal domain
LYSYRIAGLAVTSEIELPGAVPAPAAGAAAIAVRAAPVPAALDDASGRGATWQIAGKRFLFQVPGVARFLLSGGREIVFEPAPGIDGTEVAIFLIGTVFGILLHQRGEIVLHASAVRVAGKAVLFCGASGTGKSTLAAALAQRGFPLVADDLCAISLRDGVPMVQPDGRHLKLWAQAIDKLDLAGRRGAPVRKKLEKFFVDPGEAYGEPLPLGAVYALREARPPHKPGIERPNVVDAALILRRSAYRPLLVNRMEQKADYFRAATAIANAPGIFHLTRALNFAVMPEVVGWLEQHWLDIGLTEKAA